MRDETGVAMVSCGVCGCQTWWLLIVELWWGRVGREKEGRVLLLRRRRQRRPEGGVGVAGRGWQGGRGDDSVVCR